MEKKRILICILLVIAVIFSATNVFALGGVDDIMIDNNNDENNTYLNLSQNQNQENTNTRNQNNASTVKDGNNQIPNTGIENAPIIAIGICIVSAAIAYTQIKRYNV